MTPKLSVLVVTYNHERYIREALESVFAQKTPFRFEVVVADDASTDRTRDIVARFAEYYPGRVRLSYLEKNAGDKGVTNTLRGLEACTGEYIAMLDGDDRWIVPDKLRRQVEYLDAHPDVALCFHNCSVDFEANKQKSFDTIRKPGGELVRTQDLLKDAMVQMSTIVMRRYLVDELVKRPDLLCDWYIGIVASRSGPIAYLEEVMSSFRQHSSSAFQALRRAHQWAKFVLLYEQLGDVIDPAHRELVEEAICVRSYLAAMEYERDLRFKDARRFLSRAVHSKPEWLEPYCLSYGISGQEYLARLRRRLKLYWFPPLFLAWSLGSRVAGELKFRWLQLSVKAHLHARYQRGRSVGYMLALPNPVVSQSTPGRAGVHLVWNCAMTDTVEVHLGRPDGPLISRTSWTGQTETGAWVSDGTTFFLQDVEDDVPLTQENTLDIVRVKVL